MVPKELEALTMGGHALALLMPPGHVPCLAGLKTIRHPKFDANSDGGLTDYVNKLMQTALADRTVNGCLSKAWAYHRWCNDNGLRGTRGGNPKGNRPAVLHDLSQEPGGRCRDCPIAAEWAVVALLTKTGFSSLLKGIVQGECS